ncbi:ESSS subunit of NADH:ubiquinone oxidoreductase-domain-containing protein [Durotheca rogersii]|uniref:ESSS subunit of NADH:ubiquinone oxidoreductase-domain-containing protein n=1 Tax=Durotheca rogersii TaxID=419775 RepID=UPI00221F6860|nr:ESSS subunit of NADH:ubiquinone oxidoreductase-domain-containing protein [Durotheca rogersii]KAI5866380.1 ESSS subunit of NADH:ubiquinone oxidoreductase-domain-containing protein [Durotheca rogersii]
MAALRPISSTSSGSTAAAIVRRTFNLPHQPSRSFAVTSRAPSSHHGPQFDPPTGWLFGVKPGEKYQKEGWEGPFFYGFCGSFALAIVAYAYKPDTSIQTWALEEARRRLEAEGILEDPEKKQ